MRSLTGILQGLPDDLQEQSVLRIHRAGLGAAHAEDERIEQIWIVDVPAPLMSDLFE
jgi:hypothetical protein